VNTGGGSSSPDWTGLPLRVERCLGRAKALAVMDLAPRSDGTSGRDFQEEYLEWRAIKDPGTGRLERVEMTTELPERWRLAAAYEPEELVRAVASFAREPRVAASAVFGAYDPFAPSATAAGREQAFADTMLGPGSRSPYNDGRRAICCMAQATNTDGALATLARAASRPRLVQAGGAGRARPPTAAELIPVLGEAAQLGRSSDPILVERLARLAFEGRAVGLREPVGVWIQGTQHTRLRTPTGEPVPPEWFTLSRSTSPPSTTGAARPQRLILEVPPEEGFCVGDLVDLATEEPLRYGGQVAELIQLALTIAVADSGTAASPPESIEPGGERSDPEGCRPLRVEAERVLARAPA
jgi:hypothetical protein